MSGDSVRDVPCAEFQDRISELENQLEAALNVIGWTEANIKETIDGLEERAEQRSRDMEWGKFHGLRLAVSIIREDLWELESQIKLWGLQSAKT